METKHASEITLSTSAGAGGCIDLGGDPVFCAGVSLFLSRFLEFLQYEILNHLVQNFDQIQYEHGGQVRWLGGAW